MTENELALFGSSPAFENILPVGQLYFPSWERYEIAMRGIFERKYYTNQGPLAQQLECRLQDFLGVKHAICVTNGTIGLMMAVEALELTGKVIMPAFTFAASALSLSRAGIEPVFCDVSAETHQIDINKIEPLLDSDVSGVMGVNLWGGICEQVELVKLAREKGLKIYFDSAHAFGCEQGGIKVGNFGDVEVFSFHATKILSATEGGCLCTNDDQLAAKLRNIRSSYGAGEIVDVVKTSNGRMSEAQAAIALMSLDDYSENQQNNYQLFRLYEDRLSQLPGVRLVKPSGVNKSNYQYLVCEIEEQQFGVTRDMLMSILEKENILARRYFYPGIHHYDEYKNLSIRGNVTLPVTDRLCKQCVQLPIGALVSGEAVGKICDIISTSHKYATQIQARVSKSESSLL